MKKEEIYNHLEKDFIKEGMTDDWSGQVNSVEDMVTKNFKERWMGVLFDSGNDLDTVYTAVFPSDKVMKEVLDKDSKDTVLFTHHGATWDIRNAPKVFKDIDRKLLEEFKRRNISIYTLHVPLDNFSPYSTGVSFAEAIRVNPKDSFAPYFGGMCGVSGEAEAKNVEELKGRVEEAINHEAFLYLYGDEGINKVSVIGGGGMGSVEEVKEGVLVTGITVKNDHSKEMHDIAKKNRINIIGATHYSSEKFACIKMVNYFKNKGISSEFIEDVPVMEDL